MDYQLLQLKKTKETASCFLTNTADFKTVEKLWRRLKLYLLAGAGKELYLIPKPIYWWKHFDKGDMVILDYMEVDGLGS